MAATKRKRTGGRPNLGRTEDMVIRVLPEEKQRFTKAAAEDGFTLSDWVRFNLRACSAPKPAPVGATVSLTGKNE